MHLKKICICIPDNTYFISGLAFAPIKGKILPQHRVLIKLTDEVSGDIVGQTASEQNGFYEFTDLEAGTYTVQACQQIDGEWIGFKRVGITLPPSNPFVSILLSDQNVDSVPCP